jgi:CRISPR system Cascade subunit CasB
VNYPADGSDSWTHHARSFARGIEVTCCGQIDPATGTYKQSPDKGARAALRSGLRKPVEEFGQSAHKCVLDVASKSGPEQWRTAWLQAGVRPDQERAYYAVAAMIAAQARDARDQSAGARSADRPLKKLGAAVADLDKGEPMEGETPREAELRALSRQSLNGIHRRLPDLVRQLRQADIRLDWAQLIIDLSRWDRYRDDVAKSWNQEYYRTRYRQRAENNDKPNTPDAPESEGN